MDILCSYFLHNQRDGLPYRLLVRPVDSAGEAENPSSRRQLLYQSRAWLNRKHVASPRTLVRGGKVTEDGKRELKIERLIDTIR